jgi:phosphoglycerol geranylgeranyltransferase
LRQNIYTRFSESKRRNKKALAVLIDPDKIKLSDIKAICKDAASLVDYFLVGGSLILKNSLDDTIKEIKKHSKIPVILFPGNVLQISAYADATLFLSLISGRNAELLIGNHVIAAPVLKSLKTEVIPTGYMLIDGGKPTSVNYMSNTFPIPSDKYEIAQSTAMAGEMLGLKLIYLEAGSGASNPINKEIIKKVSASISIPLLVGGGIKTPEKAEENCNNGADVIVIGNAVENDFSLVKKISKAIHSFNK